MGHDAGYIFGDILRSMETRVGDTLGRDIWSGQNCNICKLYTKLQNNMEQPFTLSLVGYKSYILL